MDNVDMEFIKSKENIDNVNNIIKKIRTKELIEKQNILMIFFKEVIDVLNKYQIPWWASNGTLIGALRHNGFIPWDDDIDICSHSTYIDKLLSINWKNYNLEFIKHAEISENEIFFRFCSKKYPNKIIDFFITKPNTKIANNLFKNYLSEEEIFPLKKIKFGDYEVNTPNNFKNYFQRRYFNQDVLRICNVWNHNLNDYWKRGFDNKKYLIFIEDLII